MPMDENQSVRIEKIANGFLSHHSTSDPKKGYVSKTVYHPKKPTLKVSVEASVKDKAMDKAKGVKEGSAADKKMDAKMKKGKKC